MSRQARIETEIEVKDADSLKEAVRIACKDLNGLQINAVRYYAGKIDFGIKIGHNEIGVVVQKNKIVFVGEDIYVNSETGKKARAAVLKNYSTLSAVKALKKLGFRVTASKGMRNTIVGVRA